MANMAYRSARPISSPALQSARRCARAPMIVICSHTRTSRASQAPGSSPLSPYGRASRGAFKCARRTENSDTGVNEYTVPSGGAARGGPGGGAPPLPGGPAGRSRSVSPDCTALTMPRNSPDIFFYEPRRCTPHRAYALGVFARAATQNDMAEMKLTGKCLKKKKNSNLSWSIPRAFRAFFRASISREGTDGKCSNLSKRSRSQFRCSLEAVVEQ